MQMPAIISRIAASSELYVYYTHDRAIIALHSCLI